MRNASFFDFMKKSKDEKITKEITDILRNNCVSYLSNLRRLIKGNKNLFYSYILLMGTKQYTDDYAVIKRLYSKKDVVLTHEISKIFDTEFIDKYDIAGRSGCIKTTANINFAKKYGNLYVVFPLRRWYFLWSPLIKNLPTYVQENQVLRKYLLDMSHKIDVSKNEEGKIEFEKTISSYQTTNIKYAMETGNEIMVKAPQYLIIKGDTFVSLKQEIWDLMYYGK